MKVFLTGFMGSGKTIIGSMLAEKLSWHFLDMDILIKKKSGKTITKLFELHGECTFREMERDLLSEIFTIDKNLVVASGGGAPCYSGNMDRMNKNGITIYIKLSPDLLFERLQHHLNDRPLLSDKKNLKSYIMQTLAERENYYNNATHIIEVHKTDTEKEIADQIDKLIKKHTDGN
ncbi:MAG TPA: shikimate kinase [Bacteroidales bacterium]|nr:shikimate kinase [Bacteroidales bacterium]